MKENTNFRVLTGMIDHYIHEEEEHIKHFTDELKTEDSLSMRLYYQGMLEQSSNNLHRLTYIQELVMSL